MQKFGSFLGCLFLLCSTYYLNAQSVNNYTVKQPKSSSVGKVKWINTDYTSGNILAFEENKGQYPATANGWNILYGCTLPGIDIYFTDKGIIYNIAKADNPKNGQGNIDWDKEKKETIRYQHIFISFESCSSTNDIEGQDETPYYFNQGMPGDPLTSISNIKGFKKIVYHNIYPGVDLEFSIPNEKGIKYAIKIKSGTNAGAFKMKYQGTKGLRIDGAGNLHIGTLLGDIIDHTPFTTSDGAQVPSSFCKTGENVISFNVNVPKDAKDITIDPWTSFPSSSIPYAIDISMDAANNTYVLGYTDMPKILMYLSKYNTTGGLVWVYVLNEFTTTPFNKIEVDSASTGPAIVSDFVTDPNGNSYVANSLFWANTFSTNTFGQVCITSTGLRKYLSYNYSADSISETWNMSYSCADSLLIEGGCRICCDHAQFDAVNIATGLPYPGECSKDAIGEIYAGTIAPNGNYYAMTAIPNDNTTGPDSLICGKASKTGATLFWAIPIAYPDNDYDFRETPEQLGTNGIVASCSYLYTSDGLTLDQRDLTNGSLIKSITIPKGNNNFNQDNSGIGIDQNCGNLYVGSDSAIYAYDQNLNPIGSYTGLPGKVFDVTCNNNGVITACGDNFGSSAAFVVQISVPVCATSPGLTITGTNIPCGKPNSGTATANATGTSCTGTYTYLWNPSGQTTQTATGLSAGVYTVTASPAGACFSLTDTITIKNESDMTLTVSTTDSDCLNNVNAVASGGTLPLSYKWSSGQTTSSITGVPSGYYKITVTDKSGCVITDSVKANASGISLSACCNDTIMQGNNATITAYSDSTISYSWSPNVNCLNPLCDSVTVTPTVTTTYTVTGTSRSGCQTISIVTINVETPCADFTVPNVFTPNNDGINDDFVISTSHLSSYSILIYDRWGKEVYASTDPTVYWNGTISKTPNLVPDGVYYYIIKATCGKNNYNKKGFVEVIGEN